MDFNQRLIEFLSNLGVTDYFGVSGGGLIQFLKHIPPYHLSNKHSPRFYNLSEYAAGFAPLGYYLSTQRIAACVATTGAAQHLVSNGISDARFMNIPAIYLLSLSSEAATDTYPIQDVSSHGMNMVSRFKQESHEDVFVIDSESSYIDIFDGIHKAIINCRPVMIFFRPEVLCMPDHQKYSISARKLPPPNDDSLEELIHVLESLNGNSRVVVFCCAETSITNLDTALFSSFINKIDADVIYTVNGDNTATLTNERNLGHIMLGANDAAYSAWKSINCNDLIICLGVDVGEYAINMQHFPKARAFYISQYSNAYGQIDGSYNHLFDEHVTQISGYISDTLNRFLELTETISFSEHAHFDNTLDDLHTHSCSNPKQYVDLIQFYRQLDSQFMPNSLAFEDVCIAYRDRQAILKNPNKNIRFYSSNHGSAMGGAFGIAVGAAIADSNSKVFLFSGDGCFRLYGGSLAESRHLNITLFIMNNSELSIIHDGCNHMINDNESYHYHEFLEPINWIHLARGFGWRAVSLKPDLSNLSEIMAMSYDKSCTSILVEVPVDCTQIIGKNFRYKSLAQFPNL